LTQLHAVILAGGAGQRFWPRSRRRHPKPLLRVLGSETLLAATLRRARRFAAPGCVWVVCGREHARAVRRESGLPAGRVLVEPHARNTAMAVGWAAERIAAEFPGAVLAMLPADHWIPDAGAFARAIRVAARAAARADVLVTLGVRPTRPEPGYGYIQLGPAVGKAHKRLHRVARFVEKPDVGRARRYLRRGGYLWNAGVFVWSAAVIREEIQTHAPELHRALGPIRARPRGAGARAALERAYRRAPSRPIDVAVLERSRRVWTLPADFRWSDVGTWGSLAEVLGVGPETSRVLGGRALLEDAPANLVWGDGRLIALLGVRGLAVIDTPDALLVASLERSGDVRRLVGRLATRRDRGLT
jgi:mannose-1-phosphate guanylyltransferase